MLHHIGYEVTTYRIDGEYEDGRHPKKVIFTNDKKPAQRKIALSGKYFKIRTTLFCTSSLQNSSVPGSAYRKRPS